MSVALDPPRIGARWVLPFLGAVTFLTAIGNIGLVSVMPTIGRLLHIPDFLVAGIFSLSALTWAISAPFWVGRIERKGPNPYIRAGLFGFVLSMGGCALSVELGLLGLLTPFAAFLLFSVLRSTYGLLGSAAATATQALIAVETAGAARTRAITTLAGALSLGTIVGPAIAPMMIVDPLGPLGPMLGFALLGGLALAGAFICLPRDRHRGTPVPGGAAAMSLALVWRRKGIGQHLSFGLLLCSAQAINLYTIGFVIIDRMADDPMAAQRMIGLAMTTAAAAALLGQWGFVRLFAPSPLSMMRIGTAFALAGNGLAVFDGHVYAAVVGFVLASFGYGLARPGFSAAASLAGATEDQVAIASAITFIAGASITLPPVIASAAYQWWRPAPFAIAAAIGGALLISHLLPVLVRHIVHDER
ncbi:MFS transporter [Sphingopyxis lindanitolerans]|uniref:MFS transporter n=1 Tax=Sphingopyxis lindanitolerans TaxID=2054227 RepID=A0A2S8B5I5_9SPHN|nr:MFS transporter [Sphingopyxis lindanitolerans]PQM27519.1 MFS transporter [Sphingopyxis lindanitolerans]